MSYKIEKNIQIPLKRTRKYPFDEMEVGDSFMIEGYTPKKIVSITSSANSFCKTHRNGWKFTVRKIEGDIRIWRVK